jgi:hypothetical protein
VRKRPEIPEDVFFDTPPDNEADGGEEAPVAESEPADERDVEPNSEPDPRGDVLRKSMEDAATPTSERSRTQSSGRDAGADESDASRIGRPPAQEGPKDAVTLYLTEPVAHMLEEVKFRLLTEYGVKTSKSAIADFAIRNGLNDLQAAADDLRRE